ncbi:hypothetical protein RFI_24172, partial [Reticulomyxa filosa]
IFASNKQRLGSKTIQKTSDMEEKQHSRRPTLAQSAIPLGRSKGYEDEKEANELRQIQNSNNNNNNNNNNKMNGNVPIIPTITSFYGAPLTTNASSKELYEQALSEDRWQSDMSSSLWYNYIRLLLGMSIGIVGMLHLEKKSVLIHCSDGWDRTAQLSSLAQILLDPYFRTIQGLCTLIEKDWVSFGHKFRERFAHVGDDTTEQSPVFIQFLDCLYQLLCQFPTHFEYNDNLLTFIAYHVTSCRFGTFLNNCEAERYYLHVPSHTPSIWHYILQCVHRYYETRPHVGENNNNNAHCDADDITYLSEDFVNSQYKPCPHVLFPDHRAMQLTIWPFYLRIDPFPSTAPPSAMPSTSQCRQQQQQQQQQQQDPCKVFEKLICEKERLHQAQTLQMQRQLLAVANEIQQLKQTLADTHEKGNEHSTDVTSNTIETQPSCFGSDDADD